MINKTKIATITGYSRGHITSVLNGQMKPSVDCLRALSRAMKMSMEEVLHYIKTKELPKPPKKRVRKKRVPKSVPLKEYFLWLGRYTQADPNGTSGEEVESHNPPTKPTEKGGGGNSADQNPPTKPTRFEELEVVESTLRHPLLKDSERSIMERRKMVLLDHIAKGT